MPPSHRKHALVIGIDRYPDPRLPDLEGCVRDAHFASEVLRRFGFSAPLLLTDGKATRDGILTALDDLAERVRDDDVVVVHYSGHGSQMPDRELDETDGDDETLVPHDSGRNPNENRDITDDELHRWLLRVVRRTPYVTLVLDSCHSGTAVRNVPGLGVRRAPREERSVRELPPSPVAGPGPERRGVRRSDNGAGRGPSGWLSPVALGQRYTLLAACRDHESACEHTHEGERYGAFSWHLYDELARGGSDLSYRDVVQRFASQLTAAYRQHPQVEGARDRAVFGTGELVPVRFFPVLVADPAPPSPTPRKKRVGSGRGGRGGRGEGRGEDVVRLGAGAALGVTGGSELAIYPAETRAVTAETPWRARVRVTAVHPLSADVEVLERRGKDPIREGDRAVMEVRAYDDDASSVDLADVVQCAPPWAADLRRRIGSSDRLVVAEDGAARADFRLLRLPPPGKVRPDAPLCELVPFDGEAWAVVDRMDRLQAPLVRRTDDPAAGLVRVLERWDHSRRVLELRNRCPRSALHGAVTLQVYRFDPDAGEHHADEHPATETAAPWCLLQPNEEGRVVCREGERIGLEVSNGSDRPLHVYVLAFGLTGGIDQLYPPKGGQDALSAGGTLRVAMQEPGPVLQVGVPRNYPRPAASHGAVVRVDETLKVFATTSPLDLEPLLRPPMEDGRRTVRRTRNGSHPLARLLARREARVGVRDVGWDGPPPDDWTTAQSGFELEIEPGAA